MKLSFHALALTLVSGATYAKIESIGLLMKNKSTGELLGVACTERAEDQTCSLYQFKILQKVSKTEYQIMDSIGKPISYSTLKYFAERSREEVRSRASRDSFAIDGVALDTSVSSYPLWLITDATYGNFYGADYSVPEKIFRRAFGAVLLPFALVVDGVRLAAEGVAVGAAVVFYEAPNSLYAKNKSEGTYENIMFTVYKKRAGKVVKLKDREFNDMVHQIRGL